MTRPTSRRERRTGRSPYAKYAKTPFMYSAAYQQWRSQFKRREKSSNYTAN